MPNNSKPSPKKKLPADRILAMLRDGDRWRSGEDLAAVLGMTRAAVAKHVAKLRRVGHVIEGTTRRGYRLVVEVEKSGPGEMEPLLRTHILGRTGWRWLAETDSTNSDALAWALSGAPEGALVIAGRQTGGKGRRGHVWFSPPRSLQFSIVFRADGRAWDAEILVAKALLAMAEATRNVAGLDPAIKQPNDLLLGKRKIAGVLVETGSRGGEPDWLVLGVGCNVNVLPEEFPEALRPGVTSLYAEGGRRISQNRLLAEFLLRFEQASLFGEEEPGSP